MCKFLHTREKSLPSGQNPATGVASPLASCPPPKPGSPQVRRRPKCNPGRLSNRRSRLSRAEIATQRELFRGARAGFRFIVQRW